MPRKGENIYKRKDGRWEGRFSKGVSENGKMKFKYVYGHTYSETKNKLYEIIKSYTNESVHKKDVEFYYRNILISWLQSAKLRTTESTYSRYFYLVTKYITPKLGQYKISQLSIDILEKYIENLLISGRVDHKGGLSAKFVSDILVVIKSSLKYAKLNNISVFFDISNLNVKYQKKEIRILSKDEQKRLIAFLRKRTDYYKLGILLSLFTGMRVGEVCALKWENINLNEGSIEICKTIQRIKNVDPENKISKKTKIIITKPKSKCSIRKIPIPNYLIETLESLYSTPDSYILSGNSQKYVEPRKLQYHFQMLARELSIQNINYHALRHTFATRCIESGFEIKSLSEILGHANVNITLNCYIHSSFDLKMKNMNKLSWEE